MKLRRRVQQLVPRALAAAVMLAATLGAAPASAGPSVWTRARDPKVNAQEETVREAQRAFLRYRRMRIAAGPRAPSVAALMLKDTRMALARVVESGAADFGARLLYADVLRESRENDAAIEVLKKLLADRPPAPIRADALGDIAILYAMTGQREHEIRSYTQALEIEPHGLARSQLLANRAEAMMAVGDVTAAIDGYRAALAPLTTVEMFWRGSTTLFSLGVALDRAGNPEAGMESVRLARSYDPADKALTRGTWFFSPPHDEHWYWALGAWTCGRSGSLWALRAECYERAVAEWEQYIQAAPEGDPWVALAKVRLAAVKRERDELKRTFEARKKAEAQGQSGGSRESSKGLRSGFVQ